LVTGSSCLWAKVENLPFVSLLFMFSVKWNRLCIKFHPKYSRGWTPEPWQMKPGSEPLCQQQWSPMLKYWVCCIMELDGTRQSWRPRNTHGIL